MCAIFLGKIVEFSKISFFLIANPEIALRKLKVKANLTLSSLSWTTALKKSISALPYSIVVKSKTSVHVDQAYKNRSAKKKKLLKHEIALVSFEATSFPNLRANEETAFDS